MEAGLGSTERGIVQVSNLPSNTNTVALTIHFQKRKNGGGEVEHVRIIGDGVALVAFEETEVAESVLARKHTINGKEVEVVLYHPRKLQIFDRVTAKLNADLQLKLGGGLRKLLEQVKNETKVDWHEASDGFLLSGTLEQLIQARTTIHQSLCDDSQSKNLAVLSDTNKILKSSNFAQIPNEREKRLNHTRKQNVKSENDAPDKKTLVSHEGQQPNSSKVGGISKRTEVNTVKSSVTKKSPLESENANDYRDPKNQQLNPMQNASYNDLTPGNEAGHLPYSSANAQSITASVNNYNESNMEGKKADASSDSRDAKEEVVQRACTIPAGMMRFLRHVHSEIFTNLEKCVDVQIQEGAEKCKLTLMRKVGFEREFEIKCKEFSSFYRKLKQKTLQREIKLDKQKQSDDKVLQTVINDVKSGLLVWIDASKDSTSLTIYGTHDNVTFAAEIIQAALHVKDVDKNSIIYGADNKLECMTKTGITLSVLKGDITMETADVIVNAANERLAHGGGVAKAIVDKGGRGIQDESLRIVGSCGKIEPGKVAWTRAGALPCKGIIHAIGPRWKTEKGTQCKKILGSAVTESLLMASGFRMKSIAFPPISAGIFGMPPAISAKVMFDAALKFANNIHPTYEGISDIRFVVIDDPTFVVFKEEFITRFSEEDAYPEQFTDRSKEQSSVTETTYSDKKLDTISSFGTENDSVYSYTGTSTNKPQKYGGAEIRTSVNGNRSDSKNRPQYQSTEEQINYEQLGTRLGKSQSDEQNNINPGSETAMRNEEPIASLQQSGNDSPPRGTHDSNVPYKRKAENEESRSEDSKIAINERNIAEKNKKASSQYKPTSEELLLKPSVECENKNEKKIIDICTPTVDDVDLLTSLVEEMDLNNATQSSDASNEIPNKGNERLWATQNHERQGVSNTRVPLAEVDVEPESLIKCENMLLNCSVCSTHIDKTDFHVQGVCKIHNFCDDCLLKSLPFCNQCPVCHDVYGIFKKSNHPNGEVVSQTERGNPSTETGKTLEVSTEETGCLKKLNQPSSISTESSSPNKEGDLLDSLAAGSEPYAGNTCSTQPPGHMTWSNYSQSLPGYDSTATIAVTFAFYDGVQGEHHPHPGQPYKGTKLTVYLPNTADGKQVLKLFRKAFGARLLFTVGCNTHGVDEVDWNGVRPKLCINGTFTRGGFPDQGSLQRVKLELISRVKGI